MKTMTPAEYRELCDMCIGDAPEIDTAVEVYVAEEEINPKCPYIGVKYSDGSLWIFGARSDHKCENMTEVEWYLEQN